MDEHERAFADGHESAEHTVRDYVSETSLRDELMRTPAHARIGQPEAAHAGKMRRIICTAHDLASVWPARFASS